MGNGIDCFTSCCLHGDTEADSSIYARTVTKHGSAAISTVQKKFGASSWLFSASTSDYLTMPYSEAFEQGGGDFCVDCWIYPTNLTGYHAICGVGTTAVSRWAFLMDAAKLLVYDQSFGEAIKSASVLTLNAWQHVALFRRGAYLSITLDGTTVSTSNSPTYAVFNRPSDPFEIGANTGSTLYFDGYIDEFRYSIGTGRFSPPFSAPAAAYSDDYTDPDVSNVKSGTTYVFASANKTGTYSASPTNPDYVIHSQGGNWIDENVVAGNLLVGVTAGVGGAIVGTFDEAARNVGTAAGNLLVGSSIKIQNVTTNGTFDEAARNTDPGVANVLAPTAYKIQNVSLVGTATGGGGSITPAAIHGTDAHNGTSATLSVTASPSPAAVNQVYTARFLANGPQAWTLRGSVTGNGTVTVTLAQGDYLCKVVTSLAGATGTAVGNLFSVSSAENARRARIRDRTAKSALRVAMRLGRRVYWHNPGVPGHVEVWAVCEGGFESLSLLGGETSATRFTLWIPRQTGFPPAEGLKTGAAIWVDGVPYACQVSYDAESPVWAPVFRCDCSRFDVTVELDGQTPPA